MINGEIGGHPVNATPEETKEFCSTAVNLFVAYGGKRERDDEVVDKTLRLLMELNKRPSRQQVEALKLIHSDMIRERKDRNNKFFIRMFSRGQAERALTTGFIENLKEKLKTNERQLYLPIANELPTRILRMASSLYDQVSLS